VNPASHYRWQGSDLWLELQGKPGARRDAFGRVMGGRLQVQIAAAPEDGKATARLIAFLAEAFDVPRAAVVLRYGLASPKKGVTVQGPRRMPPEAGIAPPAAANVSLRSS
jgi:uncharacterized protein (TIGR00251 family)